MRQDFESYDRKVKDAVDKFKEYKDGQIQFYKREFEAYRNQFGSRSLTKSERERLEGFLEQLKNMPETDENYDED